MHTPFFLPPIALLNSNKKSLPFPLDFTSNTNFLCSSLRIWNLKTSPFRKKVIRSEKGRNEGRERGRGREREGGGEEREGGGGGGGVERKEEASLH